MHSTDDGDFLCPSTHDYVRRRVIMRDYLWPQRSRRELTNVNLDRNNIEQRYIPLVKLAALTLPSVTSRLCNSTQPTDQPRVNVAHA